MPEHLEKLAERLRGATVGTQSPLPPSTLPPPPGTQFDEGFPKSAWVTGIKDWAEGRNGSYWFPSAEEKMVREANKSLSDALTGGASDARAGNTTKALEDLLTCKPASVHAHPDQARQQQSLIVLESLLVSTAKGGKIGDSLSAVAALSPEAQRQLFMADALTGNRLYNQFHQAQQEYTLANKEKELGARDKPDLEAAFKEARVGAQQASVLVRMNLRDPSGTEARLTTQFFDHLQKSGVSPEARRAFAEKLAFKSQVMGSQDKGADLASLSVQKDIGYLDADPQGRFTGQLYSALAETPGVSDVDLAKSMDLPQKDLLRVAANCAHRNREGDRRILQTVSEAVKDDVLTAKNETLRPLHDILENVSAGRYSNTEFAREVSAGKDIGLLKTTLSESAEKSVQQRSTGGAKVMNEVLTNMVKRRDYLRDTLIKTLDGPEKIKAQNQHDELDAFVKRFPPDHFTKEKMETVFRKFGSNMIGPVDPFKNSGIRPDTPTSPVNSAFYRGFMAFTQQMDGHINAIEKPSLYGKGLDQVMPVLPTAGRDLRDCPWLGSTAGDLARTAKLVRTDETSGDYSLAQTPIIVIDQSDARDPVKKELWNKNDVYCRELEKQHADVGLKIVHVSMEDVNRLAGDGLKKMFDTTGQGFAGYGGARNMAYLLAPMIRQCELDGTDWRKMDAETALPLIQKYAIEKNSAKYFMGDDTDQISEGATLAKSVLAREYSEDFTLISNRRDGRDTMGVSEDQTNEPSRLLLGGLDNFTYGLHSTNKWNGNAKQAGMGCTFGDPRFCLDLPLGAEEKQCMALKTAIDNFSQSTHLSGDRQRDLGDYFSGHLAYTNSSSMVKSLLESGALPWNSAQSVTDQSTGKSKFNSLDAVMKFASDPVQQKAGQQAFFKAMVKWRGQGKPEYGPLSLDRTPGEALDALKPNAEGAEQIRAALKAAPEGIKTANGAIVDYYIKQHPELKPEDRLQLIKVRDAYEQAGAEITLGRQYMDKLMDELVPATDKHLAGSKLSSEELAKALETSLAGDPPDKAALAVAKVKKEMESQGVDFNKNRLLRDVHLMTESAGAGGFAKLAQKLHGPSQEIRIDQAPKLESEGIESLDVPKPILVRDSLHKEPTNGVEKEPLKLSKEEAEVEKDVDVEDLLEESLSTSPRLKEKEPLTTRDSLTKGGWTPKKPTHEIGGDKQVVQNNL